MKKPLWLGVIALNTFLGFSQNELIRVEIDLKENYKNHEVFPLENKGLVLISNAEKGKDDALEIKTDFYNTELQLIDSKSVYIKDRSSVTKSYQENGINYSLFQNKRDYVAVVVSNSNDNTVKKIETTYSSDRYFSDIIAKHNKVYFTTINDKKEVLVIIDLESDSIKETPIEIDDVKFKDLTIKEFQVVEDEVIVYLNRRNSKTSSDIYIATLDLLGNLNDIINITEGIDEKLISIAATKVDSKYIITGTYSKTKSDMSQGIYLAEISDKKLQFIKFYNFVDLNNFTSFMSDRNQRKIERRAEDAEKNDKEYLVNYNIKTHDIKVLDDGYTFIGEAYIPIHVYVNNGRIATRQFSGYSYSHAVICKFDFLGNMIWDNSLKMYPRSRTFYVKQFIRASYFDNSVDLSFGDVNKLVYKKIDLVTGATLKDKDVEFVNIDLEGDKVRRTNNSLESWYDNYFVAFGTQVLTNSDAKGKRKVFFLNKVSFDKN